MAGNDFGKNPGGANDGTVRPRDFLAMGQRQRPATPQAADVNMDDAAPGPATASEVAKPGTASGDDVGVGTLGGSSKPYRLGG